MFVRRAFDLAMPTREINAAVGHYKNALGSRLHGLNRNCLGDLNPGH